jgi:hypothetical protein
MAEAARELLEALGVDGALTVAQARRASGSGGDALRAGLRGGLLAVERRPVRPSGYSRRCVDARVVTLTAAGAEAAAQYLGATVGPVDLRWDLEHRLGLAEARHRLGVPWRAWTTATALLAQLQRSASRRARGLPDALARIGGRVVAVEYDHGRYAGVQILAKRRLFPQLADRTVWAAPTPQRAEWLRAQGCADVLVVQIPLEEVGRRDRVPAALR